MILIGQKKLKLQEKKLVINLMNMRGGMNPFLMSFDLHLQIQEDLPIRQ